MPKVQIKVDAVLFDMDGVSLVSGLIARLDDDERNGTGELVDRAKGARCAKGAH